MKKTISTFLSFLLLFVSVPQMSRAQSFTIGGGYEVKSDKEEINCYIIGNKIYVNGIHEATIIENTFPNNLNNNINENMLRTGWMYTETCPFGTASDYTNYIDTKTRNIYLEREIATYTSIVLGAIISSVYSSIPQGIAIGIAGKILSNLPGSNYGNLKTLYFKEDIYAHKSVGSIYRKNVLNFYFDSNFTEYATSQVMYSWWG